MQPWDLDLAIFSLPLEAQALAGSISLLWNLVRKKGEKMSLRCLNTVKFYFTKSKMTSLKILKERNNLAFDKIEKNLKKGYQVMTK